MPVQPEPYSKNHLYTSGNEAPDKAHLSSFRQIDRSFESLQFSIKYVISGTEHYKINGSPYDIGSGQYLLTGNGCAGKVRIDSPAPVRGLCIDLSPGLLAEVIGVSRNPGEPDASLELQRFLTTDEFPDNRYEAKATGLGRFLQQSERSGFTLPGPEGLPEFFYTVAEKAIGDQESLCRYFRQLDSVKAGTKKELLRRLLKGKEYIDGSYSSPLSIAGMAQAATLSPYYFLKLFRTAFGLSPYQYLMDRRLTAAARLLDITGASVSDIACEAGFGDIQGFSKAFKKRFGYCPSERRK